MICPECNQEFEPTRKGHVICSKRCQNRISERRRPLRSAPPQQLRRYCVRADCRRQFKTRNTRKVYCSDNCRWYCSTRCRRKLGRWDPKACTFSRSAA